MANTRIALLGLSAMTLMGCIGASSSAQAGFFDQLFGGGSREPAYEQPAPQYDQTQPGFEAAPSDVQRRRVVRKAAVDEKPVLQKTTDLLHDKTLRPGDAIMMKTGMHIYTGRESSTHHKSEFTPIDEASRVAPAKKTMLAALDATRNDPLAKAAAPDTVASGRSAAVSAPIVAGVKFTDQRGVTIRYVGP